MEMQMEFKEKLPTPIELKKRFPVSEEIKKIKSDRDDQIIDIFTGKDDRFLMMDVKILNSKTI